MNLINNITTNVNNHKWVDIANNIKIKKWKIIYLLLYILAQLIIY